MRENQGPEAEASGSGLIPHPSSFIPSAESLSSALDLVIRRTGVGRYRWLCSDANPLPPPNSADDWRRWVLIEASRPEGEHRPAIVVHYTDPDAPPARPCGGCPGL